MFQEIDSEVQRYHKQWEQFVAARDNQDFFTNLKPVAVGWKVADKSSYDEAFSALHGRCDRVIETWMNGRWIAKLHLKDEALFYGATIIKLMERRPGSDDALGLDHVDFLSTDEQIKSALDAEQGVEWTLESNDVVDNYEWASVWFEGGEAKIKSDTVIDIIIQELTEMNAQIKA